MTLTLHTYFCLFGMNGCGTGNGEAYLKEFSQYYTQYCFNKRIRLLNINQYFGKFLPIN